MYYWFRPSVHVCESAEAERTICGVAITGAAPTIRPLPDDASLEELFGDRTANVCENCRRILDSRRD